MPDIDASSVAEGVIAANDLDGDGAISGKELKHPSFGFRHSLRSLDTNGDGSVSQDEIREYVEKLWIKPGTALTSTKCKIVLDRKTLSDATVVFEPVEFMKGVISPASGTTRGGGIAMLDIDDEDRPHDNAHGVQCGLYVVKVSKAVNGREVIPEKYNDKSILVCEVAKRAGYKPGPVTFELTRK